MGCHPNLNSLPLAELPFKTKQLLSYLLNTNKVIPSDGPDKLPRDWRGLAHLIEIPNFVASNFHQYPDKTAKILEIWIREKTEIATVGKLLEFMQRLDRYDVHDDIMNDLQWHINGRVNTDQPYQIAMNENNNMIEPAEEVYDIITYDDTQGHLQRYDAFVLYADEDADFVDELQERLGHEFKFCTKDNLLAGHATQYTPVAQLISQRCRYIILVYSPNFVTSPANKFYTDYAQAVSIESQNNMFKRKIIPVMYRECQVPVNLMYYHKLYYRKDGRSMYDFWTKLSQSLKMINPLAGNRLNCSTSIQSSIDIEELTNSIMEESQHFLQPYNTQIQTSTSMTGLDTLKSSKHSDDEKTSLSNFSQHSVNIERTKKKSSPMKWLSKKFFRKNKKNLHVDAEIVNASVPADGNEAS